MYPRKAVWILIAAISSLDLPENLACGIGIALTTCGAAVAVAGGTEGPAETTFSPSSISFSVTLISSI